MFDITSMLGNSNTNSNNSLGSFSFTRTEVTGSL